LPYAISILESAKESLAALSPQARNHIQDKIDGLRTEPRPAGSECLEEGNPERHRVSEGEFDIVYYILKEEMAVHVETID
jgi:mRNA-degrading endonuclease RelE of RelBE toxin-antitoxin system